MTNLFDVGIEHNFSHGSLPKDFKYVDQQKHNSNQIILITPNWQKIGKNTELISEKCMHYFHVGTSSEKFGLY